MCKGRADHCLCCLEFIRDLYFIRCSKPNCQRKIVYPKIFEECEKCLKSCPDTRCNKEVQGLPRYWFTKPDQRIVKFQRSGPKRLVISTTPIGKKINFPSVAFSSLNKLHRLWAFFLPKKGFASLTVRNLC